MAPNTLSADSKKCARYGQFLKTTNHLESNGVYWACFILVLMILISAAILYATSRERQLKFEMASHAAYWHELSLTSPHPSLTHLEHSHRSAQRRSLWGSLLCSLLMIPVVIIEALAGLSVHFCHEEDLIMFYWGTFFLLSVGSLIATWGLFLSQSIENEPAWNVALGTPVLVFAALGHWLHVGVRWLWKRVWGKVEGKKEALRTPPKYLPYCHFCQESSYLSMSSSPSQESQHPLMLQRTQRRGVPSNTVEQTQSRASTFVASSPEITNGNAPRIRIQEPESKEEV